MSLRSKRATRRPRRVASRATPVPLTPPPMTMTSTSTRGCAGLPSVTDPNLPQPPILWPSTPTGLACDHVSTPAPARRPLGAPEPGPLRGDPRAHLRPYGPARRAPPARAAGGTGADAAHDGRQNAARDPAHSPRPPGFPRRPRGGPPRPLGSRARQPHRVPVRGDRAVRARRRRRLAGELQRRGQVAGATNRPQPTHLRW